MIQKQTNAKTIFTRKLAQVPAWMRTGRSEALPLGLRVTHMLAAPIDHRTVHFYEGNASVMLGGEKPPT